VSEVTETSKWRIVCEPQGRDMYQSVNNGGLVFFLCKPSSQNSDSTKQEVDRVAFDRSVSTNPDVSFKDRVNQVVEVANAAAEVLNNQLWGDGTLT
jgi:hypothetical protein